MPVKKDAELAGKPRELVLALVEAFPNTGAAMIPVNQWRPSFASSNFSSVSRVLLTLAEAPGACALTSLTDTAYHAIEKWYALSSRATGSGDERQTRPAITTVQGFSVVIPASARRSEAHSAVIPYLS